MGINAIDKDEDGKNSKEGNGKEMDGTAKSEAVGKALLEGLDVQLGLAVRKGVCNAVEERLTAGDLLRKKDGEAEGEVD